ncbi:dihydrofolate reductase [bacterium]|nr:dihydrofolate reductase [bacterium]
MISIICAIGKNKAIGKDNQLLWDIPHDLQHFKDITVGHPVIMGYKTYLSIGRPLPGRTNIILSKKLVNIPGCIVCTSLDEAINKGKEIDLEEVFIIGGGSVYAQTINLVDKLYLTIVDDTVEDADTFFPEYDQFNKVIKEEHFETDQFNYSFVELVKNNKKEKIYN